MTAAEGRALGNPGTDSAPDWFTAETIKALLIGQFGKREKIELVARVKQTKNIQRALCRKLWCGKKNSSAAMTETPKKTCDATLQICRCCNSALAKTFDLICSEKQPKRRIF